MTPTILSICIPTYNFGPYIGDTLRSILPQLSDGVEILVVDGASTDNTAEVVEAIASAHSSIRYVRLPRKGGIDADIATTMDLAHGEYCWLFSSDDIMRPGAIARLLEAITAEPDLVLCTHFNCSLEMEPGPQHPVLKLESDQDFQLTSPVEIQRYFALAQTTEAFFSFMTGLIIRRSTWNSVPLNAEYIGSCWAHAARLLSICQRRGLFLRYLHSPLVLRRGGNDSFASDGMVKRLAIAIEGFNHIAEAIFGDASQEAMHIRRALRNEYSISSFLSAKLLCTRPDDLAHLDKLVDMFYRDTGLRNKLEHLIYRLVPRTLLILAHAIRRHIWIIKGPQPK